MSREDRAFDEAIVAIVAGEAREPPREISSTNGKRKAVVVKGASSKRTMKALRHAARAAAHAELLSERR